MQRINTWQDAYNTGTAIVDLGDGLRVPLPLDGVFPGEPGPPGAGVPEGGAPLQVIRKTSAGSTTEWVSPTKSMVGLSRVDNTPDAEKPVSEAQAEALGSKADLVNGEVRSTQIPKSLAPSSVSTEVLGVGDPAAPSFYQARVTAPNGTSRTALRVDQKNTEAGSGDAVKVVNAAPSYALKVDQAGVHDAVNISSPFAGEHTALGVVSGNTAFSTVKVTNTAAQLGGHVYAAVTTNAARTGGLFGGDNVGKGPTFLSSMSASATGIAFQAAYSAGAYTKPIAWYAGHHTAGNLLYIENDGAHTSGAVVRLMENNATSTAPGISFVNQGTGDTIQAPSFTVSKEGRAKLVQVENYTSYTNGALKFADTGIEVSRLVADANPVLKVRNSSSTSTGDIAQFVKSTGDVTTRIDKDGTIITKRNAAPADADLKNGEMAFWFDAAAGNLMVQARSASGVIKTGTVVLA